MKYQRPLNVTAKSRWMRQDMMIGAAIALLLNGGLYVAASSADNAPHELPPDLDLETDKRNKKGHHAAGDEMIDHSATDFDEHPSTPTQLNDFKSEGRHGASSEPTLSHFTDYVHSSLNGIIASIGAQFAFGRAGSHFTDSFGYPNALQRPHLDHAPLAESLRRGKDIESSPKKEDEHAQQRDKHRNPVDLLKTDSNHKSDSPKINNPEAKVILGSDTNDMIKAGNGGDFVFGRDGSDTIIGGKSNDRLFGGNGDDRIFGGAGDDALIGGKGNDLLSGGSGADRFIFRPGFGHDTVLDFAVGATNRTHDIIELPKSQFSEYAALAAHLVNTAAGATLTLHDGSSLTLSHVAKADLTAADFHFVV